MRDFSIAIYKEFLNELKKARYQFVTFEEYLTKSSNKEKMAILRHDVDKSPRKALEMAEMEKMLGIRGTYYFRIKKDVFPEDEIRIIAEMGHEIGYHYEDLDAARGDVEKALASFNRNLERLREIVSVKTICMHGSPMSSYDNRKLWDEYDYRENGIVGEPYFDIDFNKVMYLTDTGRMWDGGSVSIRDRVSGYGRRARDDREERRQKTGGDGQGAIGEREERGQKKESIGQLDESCRSAVCDPPVLRLHSTADMILALKNDRLPDKIMLTIHPQRWTDKYIPWMVELIWQKVKNPIKSIKRKRMKKMQKK